MGKWTPADIKDQSGRVVVVTGASSGIGLAAANHLADKGARVIAAVRNTEKAKRVLNNRVDIRYLDLTDLDQIREFARNTTEKIDVLLNNAGVMAIPLSRTKQGFEMQMGTNHFGHFALTGLLFPQITDRVVTVSSTAHRMGKINLDDINWKKSYKKWRAYGQSKLANLLFTLELDRRIRNSNSKILALAVHPGYSNTALQGKSGRKIEDSFMNWANRFVAQSADQGSWPSLYACVEDIPSNSFIGPDGFGEMRGHPRQVKRNRAASDKDFAKKLWQVSEELTGVHFPLSE